MIRLPKVKRVIIPLEQEKIYDPLIGLIASNTSNKETSVYEQFLSNSNKEEDLTNYMNSVSEQEQIVIDYSTNVIFSNRVECMFRFTLNNLLLDNLSIYNKIGIESPYGLSPNILSDFLNTNNENCFNLKHYNSFITQDTIKIISLSITTSIFNYLTKETFDYIITNTKIDIDKKTILMAEYSKYLTECLNIFNSNVIQGFRLLLSEYGQYYQLTFLNEKLDSNNQ